jgi:hypothetical protein
MKNFIFLILLIIIFIVILFPVILAFAVGNYWLILLYIVWWIPGLVLVNFCVELSKNL